MELQPQVLLVGLSHRNMGATVRALRRHGFRVENVKTLPEGPRALDASRGLDRAPTIHPVPSWLPLPARTRTVMSAADETCVLILAAGGGTRGRNAVLAGRIRGIPVVLRTQVELRWDASTASPWERGRVALRRWSTALLARILGIVRITPSLGHGNAIRTGGIRHVPHPVEVTLDAPPALPDAPLRVVTVTRCLAKKNNPGLLALAGRVADAGIVFDVIFGEGPDCADCGGRGLDDLRALVLTRELHNVTAHGPQDDLTDRYRAAHVVIRTSLYEAANVTVIEGAAEGCIPLVSTRSGAGPGLFDEDAGCVVEADDLEAQERFLRSLATDVALRERLRSEAMSVVRERCDPDAFVTFLRGHMRAARRP